MFRQTEPPSALEDGLDACSDLLLSGEEAVEERVPSVGVGGVLTMTGASFSLPVGVRGGFDVSILGGALDLRSGDATLAAAGGSRTGGMRGAASILELDGDAPLEPGALRSAD